MKIKTGIVLFALFLVIFIGGGLLLFGDDLFDSNLGNTTTSIINLATSTQTSTDSTISTQSSIITVTTTPTQFSLTNDSLVNNILEEDSITLDIYDSTAWNNYNKPTTLPINIFGVYISPIFVLSPGQQVIITITSEIPISRSSSPNGIVMEVLNTGSNIINWNGIQYANISSEIYNVNVNSRVMILTIENIENYTSYYCLKLRNFSSSSASCMYMVSDTGNKVPVVTRTTITSIHMYTVTTITTMLTTLVGPVTTTTTITPFYTIPIPEFTITVPSPTTIGFTTITHVCTVTTLTSTTTVTVIVPEV